MKTANFTLSLMLAACFTLPAMGYSPDKHTPSRLERIENKGKSFHPNMVSNKQPISHLTRIDSKAKGGAKGTISPEQLERIIAKETSFPRAEQKQPIATCKCIQNATEEDMLGAEVELQRIRDMKNSNATFETYPQMLQKLCACANCTCPKETPQKDTTVQPALVAVGDGPTPPTKESSLNEVQLQRQQDMQEEGPAELESGNDEKHPPYW